MANFSGVVGVKTDRNIYLRPGVITGNWGNALTTSGDFLSVRINGPSGGFYAIKTDNKLYQATALNGPWNLVPNSQSIVDIAVVPPNNIYNFMAGDLVGIRSSDNTLLYRSASTGTWSPIPGGVAVKSIAFDGTGNLYGVGKDDNFVYKYTVANGVASWNRIGSYTNYGVSAICFGGNTNTTLYAVGGQNMIYAPNDINTLTDWTQIVNTGSIIAVDMLGVGGGGA